MKDVKGKWCEEWCQEWCKEWCEEWCQEWCKEWCKEWYQEWCREWCKEWCKRWGNYLKRKWWGSNGERYLNDSCNWERCKTTDINIRLLRTIIDIETAYCIVMKFWNIHIRF